MQFEICTCMIKNVLVMTLGKGSGYKSFEVHHLLFKLFITGHFCALNEVVYHFINVNFARIVLVDDFHGLCNKSLADLALVRQPNKRLNPET
jgi:hypothetical protein